MRHWPLLLALAGCAEPELLAKSEIGPWFVEPKPVHHATVEAPVVHAEERPKRSLSRARPAPPSDVVRPPDVPPSPKPTPPPLRPRRVVGVKQVERPARLPPAPRSAAVEVATIVGGGGLAIAAVGGAVALEDPNPGSLVLSGVGLGIGVIGLATAGVLALIDQDEEKSAVVVEPSGLGLTVRF